MAPTQIERKAETRERLLDAAAELFGERGFDAVSVEAVADAAGRTTGALYAHFGSKEGLLLALLRNWSERSATEVSGHFDEPDDLDGQLRVLWSSFTSPPPDRGASWQLLEHELWLRGARSPELGRQLAKRFGNDRALLADGVEFWTKRSAEPALPAKQTSVLVMGLLIGLAMQHRVDPRAVPASLVVDGLRLLIGAGLDGDARDEATTTANRGTHR